ncbi:hypothetical protein NXG04_06890 [Klebsiella pneumoniae]|nr:hypothetical protein [Klebsiella pneumoniae]MDS7714295.1 hypothetical protein [Klebsiella pneumoniae]
MKYPKELTNIKFGRLTVVRETEKPTHLKRIESYWICKCECGKEIISGRNRLITNHTTSCGCFQKEKVGETNKTHGLSGSRFFKTYHNMINRCEKEDNPYYEFYGGRGISVSKEWSQFEGFMNDMYQSYLDFEKVNGKGTATLDRIDNNGNYESSNCRWITMKEQSRNKRNNIEIEINGVIYKTIADVSDKYGIHEETIRSRYHSGKRNEELIKPIGRD